MLSTSAVAALSTPYVEVPFIWDIPAGFYEGAKYGHGLFITEYRGVRVPHHGGTINGFGAFVLMAPEHRFAVIVLANRTGSIPGKTLEKAMELSLPLKPRPRVLRRRAAPMTRVEMQRYVGAYVNGEATPAEFVLVPGAGGRPEYLHSFMGAARRAEPSP